MPTALLALRAHDDRARRLQTHRTPCTESADDRARRLMPHRTPCTMAPTTVRTSAAHLALRARLHPVLARPEVLRGSLPLRALLGRLLSPILVSIIGTVDIRNWNPHAWPPHRRHPSLAPREVCEDDLFKRINQLAFPSEGSRYEKPRARSAVPTRARVGVRVPTRFSDPSPESFVFLRLAPRLARCSRASRRGPPRRRRDAPRRVAKRVEAPRVTTEIAPAR